MSIAFLYDSLKNASNWRNIFRFTNNSADQSEGSRIPALFVTRNNNQLHFTLSTSNSTNTQFNSATLPLNTPFLITMVFNGNTLSYYINKTLTLTQSYINIIGRNSSTNLIIGDSFYPSDGNILIKDFTLYNGALSQTDVNNIYDNLTNMPPA
jgi:hypothetical protein